MSNMSYCQFQNTVADLQSCANALDDMNSLNGLSEAERAAAERLIAMCRRIVERGVELA